MSKYTNLKNMRKVVGGMKSCEQPNDVKKPVDDNMLVRNINNTTIVDFWLSESIDDFDSYIPFLKVVETLTESDVVNFHINCYGGYVDVANQLRNNLNTTPATVCVMVEGVAMSAATFFFNIADEIVLLPNTIIMIHSYSGASFGKFHEQMLSADFYKKWFTEFAKDVYNNILSDEEIESVLQGKDLYFTREEFIPKAEKYISIKQMEIDELEEMQSKIDDKITQYTNELIAEKLAKVNGVGVGNKAKPSKRPSKRTDNVEGGSKKTK